MGELRGKTAIITGGSRGIGRACCLAFAREGANVVFTYNKSQDQAKQVAQEIERSGAKVLSFQADVKDYSQCRKVVEETLKTFAKLDVVLNNAGIIRDKALMMMTHEDWKDVLDTNLGGTFNMTRAAITTLLKQRLGCVINMSSVSGLIGLARQTNYSASKAGIIGFTKALAKEVGAYNIRANVVCPGYIDTDMVSYVKEDIKKQILEFIPEKRFGTADEVAGVCVFLASDKANYITGEIIKIDGGLAM